MLDFLRWKSRHRYAILHLHHLKRLMRSKLPNGTKPTFMNSVVRDYFDVSLRSFGILEFSFFGITLKKAR